MIKNHITWAYHVEWAIIQIDMVKLMVNFWPLTGGSGLKTSLSILAPSPGLAAGKGKETGM